VKRGEKLAEKKKVSASGRFENQTAGEPDGETEWLKGGGRAPNSQVFYFLTSVPLIVTSNLTLAADVDTM
jgi:hypothetical protein